MEMVSYIFLISFINNEANNPEKHNKFVKYKLMEEASKMLDPFFE